jgi:hypothetical protein
MKNLVYHYYIPYESFDADMGGLEMPDWALAGSRSAHAYSKFCNAEYMLDHERYFAYACALREPASAQSGISNPPISASKDS